MCFVCLSLSFSSYFQCLFKNVLYTVLFDLKIFGNTQSVFQSCIEYLFWVMISILNSKDFPGLLFHHSLLLLWLADWLPSKDRQEYQEEFILLLSILFIFSKTNCSVCASWSFLSFIHLTFFKSVFLFVLIMGKTFLQQFSGGSLQQASPPLRGLCNNLCSLYNLSLLLRLFPENLILSFRDSLGLQ